MSITHSELIGSREGTDSTKRSSTTELVYILRGSDDLSAMRNYLDAESLITPYADGLVYESLKREQLAPRIWRWAGMYVEPRRADESNDKLDVGEYRVSFDTTGGQIKLFWTPDHENRVKSYSNVLFTDARDFLGGINMRNGAHGPEPEGVETLIPVLKFTIHYRRAKDATEAAWFAFMRMIAGLTARTNAATFKDFQIGEVLFLGGNGVQGIDSDPVLDLHFAASQNLTGLIFDTITSAAKKGHDYLWIDYEPETDQASKRGRAKPIGVYVHQIYEPVSFTGLGVGS